MQMSIDLPFSFRYGGQSSRELVKTWSVNRRERTLDPVRKEIVTPRNILSFSESCFSQ